MYLLRNAIAHICLICAFLMWPAVTVQGQFTLEFGSGDFTNTPQFNDLTTYSFSIGIDEPLVAGGVYSNPALTVIDYDVVGVLNQPTPSGFPAFNLERTIVGDEFYMQGSSMSFRVSAFADLSDGLQVSELAADANGRIFQFNGREVGTGRYHPAFLELLSDNTGVLQNSNNMGGVNPGNNMVVDVDFGEEYIIDLAVAPALTLAPAPAPIGRGPNLLVNGGFENPTPDSNGDTDPADWNVIETMSAANPGRQVRTRASSPAPLEGGASVQLNAGNSDPLGQIWQSVEVVAGTEYEFQVFARVFRNGFQQDTYDVLIELRDGEGVSGTVLGSFNSANDFEGDLPGDDWVLLTVSAVATSDTLTVHISDVSTSVDNNLTSVGHNDGNDLALDDASLTAPGSALVGDFNGDGVVDCGDVDEYIGNLSSAATGALADLDLVVDGTIDSADVAFLIENLVMTTNGEVGTFLGDLNCDGTVNVLGDAFILVASLGNSAISYGQGDINLDGTVNVLGDAFALVSNLGMSNN